MGPCIWLAVPILATCSATAFAEEGSQGRSPEDERTAILLVYYKPCARTFPDLQAKSAAKYQQWRTKNAQAVARVEASAALLREFEDRELERKLQDPARRAEARGICEKVIDLFSLALANDSKTPQDCWNQFVNALRSGDSERASGYLTAGARQRYQKVWKSWDRTE